MVARVAGGLPRSRNTGSGRVAAWMLHLAGHRMTTNHILRLAWREEPSANRSQMTHIVELGRTVALCGVSVRVIGDPWPGVTSDAMTCRCTTCTNASYFMASGEAYL